MENILDSRHGFKVGLSVMIWTVVTLDFNSGLRFVVLKFGGSEQGSFATVIPNNHNVILIVTMGPFFGGYI